MFILQYMHYIDDVQTIKKHFPGSRTPFFCHTESSSTPLLRFSEIHSRSSPPFPPPLDDTNLICLALIIAQGIHLLFQALFFLSTAGEELIRRDGFHFKQKLLWQAPELLRRQLLLRARESLQQRQQRMQQQRLQQQQQQQQQHDVAEELNEVGSPRFYFYFCRQRLLTARPLFFAAPSPPSTTTTAAAAAAAATAPMTTRRMRNRRRRRRRCERATSTPSGSFSSRSWG